MSRCRGCAREIVWAKSPAGNLTPYEQIDAFDIHEGQAISVDKPGVTFVSHFSTCPEANRFSGSNKPAQPSLFDEVEEPSQDFESLFAEEQ